MIDSEVKVDPNGSNVFRTPWYGVPNVAFSEVAERSIAQAQLANKVAEQAGEPVRRQAAKAFPQTI